MLIIVANKLLPEDITLKFCKENGISTSSAHSSKETMLMWHISEVSTKHFQPSFLAHIKQESSCSSQLFQSALLLTESESHLGNHLMGAKEEISEDLTIKEEPVDFSRSINQPSLVSFGECLNLVKAEYTEEASDIGLADDAKRPSLSDNEIFNCDFTTHCYSGLQPHMLQQINCKVYPSKLSKKSRLKECMFQHTFSKLFHCSDCEFTAQNESSLKCHYALLHNNSKTFSCEICNYKARWKGNLIRHMLLHTDSKPFECSHCGYKARRKNHIREHMLMHSDSKPFQCSHCDYRARRKNHLKEHLLLHTNSKASDSCICIHKKRCECHVMQHILLNYNSKLFECSICNYKTSKKFNLQQHLSMHSNSKPFECSECNYKTRRRNQLKQHMLQHANSKPFECSECGYKARRKDHLKQHMLQHNPYKHVKCSFCDYVTRTNVNLKQHMLRHHTKEMPSEPRLRK